MIWLASYPRSGNTFFRIVLNEVYGVKSSTFHRESSYPLDEKYDQFPIVKTHELPGDIIPTDESIPAVYLVRDGRDCVVSLAHYRKQLLAPGSNFEQNLLEAIDAAGGSQFGGWSEHVRQWLDRASLVIRFEELISDPIRCLERLRPYVDLPEPRVDRVPTFQDLKTRDFRYGSGVEHGFSAEEREHWRKGKFREGKAGGWRNHLSPRLHLRFLRTHGEQLVRLGYEKSFTEASDSGRAGAQEAAKATASFAKPSRPTTGGSVSGPVSVGRRRRILIDGIKLCDARMDGIKRYVVELLRHMAPIAERESQRFEFCIGVVNRKLIDLREIESVLCPKQNLTLPEPGDDNAPCERLTEEAGPNRNWKGHIKQGLKTVLGAERCRRAKIRFNRLVNRLQTKTYEGDFDLVHLTLPNTWEAFRHVKAPWMTTVHDLSHIMCPQLQAHSNITTLNDGLKQSIARGGRLLAVSNATREALVQRYRLNPAEIDVVYEACASRFKPVVEPLQLQRIYEQYGLGKRPYMLTLGTVEPRKNLVNTVRAFRHLKQIAPSLDVDLAVAGQFGWHDREELERELSGHSHIKLLGYVPEHDLAALYSGASLFSYVSHYEGFGLPPLEAMSCGVPVVYGRNSSMPEVIGAGGLAADPNSVDEIASAYRCLLSDREQRDRLAEFSVLRAIEFSWQRCAEETFACYERAIAAAARTTAPNRRAA